MKIHGLQKLTLLDYPGKVACTVFFAGCQFRCPYCHNSELIGNAVEPVMDDRELLTFLRKRQGMLDGVALTGGEPLLQPELPDLLAHIRELGYPIKLDTNGALPDRLAKLVDAGLVDYVAMDVKNAPSRYAETIGIPSFDLTPIRESVSYLKSGAVDCEFRTTVVRELHDLDAIREIGDWIEGARRYFLQVFTDRETVLHPGLHAPEAGEIRRYLEAVRGRVGEAAIRGLDE